MSLKPYAQAFLQGSLVKQVLLGLILGAVVGALIPTIGVKVALLGTIFVGALKAVAPILVFILVIAAFASQEINTNANIRPILILYLVGTLTASFVGVTASFLFPTTLVLPSPESGVGNAPSDIFEVLHTLILNIVDNPVNALVNANYIGILTWAILLGLALRLVAPNTKAVIADISAAMTQVVRWVIRLAPFGVFGIVASTVATTGLSSLLSYAQLVAVLVGSMAFVALVVNPLIVWFKLRKNPYPLVFRCLSESGMMAFFSRSSAANIPVNMALAKKLGLREETYSVAVPLGAAINMAGAAITIAVLTLAAVNTLGISVDFASALLLSLMATIAACGASGVPGGSLLLIPMATSLFGISHDIAAQVIAIGVTISVIQDSVETGLNSSTDILFIAAVDLAEQEKLKS